MLLPLVGSESRRLLLGAPSQSCSSSQSSMGRFYRPTPMLGLATQVIPSGSRVQRRDWASRSSPLWLTCGRVWRSCRCQRWCCMAAMIGSSRPPRPNRLVNSPSLPVECCQASPMRSSMSPHGRPRCGHTSTSQTALLGAAIRRDRGEVDLGGTVPLREGVPRGRQTPPLRRSDVQVGRRTRPSPRPLRPTR